MEAKQVLQLEVGVDQGVMAMKGYRTFLKALELEPHHQIQFNVISRTLVGGEQSTYFTAPAEGAKKILVCNYS